MAEGAYSIVGQARDYDSRLQNAALMQPLLGDEQLLLVDALEPGGLINPVWCTYGSAPDAAFFIDQNGTIRFSHIWTDTKAIGSTLARLATP